MSSVGTYPGGNVSVGEEVGLRNVYLGVGRSCGKVHVGKCVGTSGVGSGVGKGIELSQTHHLGFTGVGTCPAGNVSVR